MSPPMCEQIQSRWCQLWVSTSRAAARLAHGGASGHDTCTPGLPRETNGMPTTWGCFATLTQPS